MPDLSDRLRELVDALPVERGMRVLEIGGGPGAAARAVAARVGTDGHVLMIDWSPAAVEQARQGSRLLIAAGRMSVLCTSAESFQLAAGETPFDLAFAFRVGALDGRHPAAGVLARARIAAAVKDGALLFIDGGNPLRVVDLAQ